MAAAPAPQQPAPAPQVATLLPHSVATPVVAAPTPAIAAPTPAIAAPTPVVAAPTPVVAAPTPAIPTTSIAAPTPVIAAPTPVPTVPNPAIPTPVIAAPTPVIAAPTPAIAAPSPAIPTTTTVPGPSHLASIGGLPTPSPFSAAHHHRPGVYRTIVPRALPLPSASSAIRGSSSTAIPRPTKVLLGSRSSSSAGDGLAAPTGAALARPDLNSNSNAAGASTTIPSPHLPATPAPPPTWPQPPITVPTVPVPAGPLAPGAEPPPAHQILAEPTGTPQTALGAIAATPAATANATGQPIQKFVNGARPHARILRVVPLLPEACLCPCCAHGCPWAESEKHLLAAMSPAGAGGVASPAPAGSSSPQTPLPASHPAHVLQASLAALSPAQRQRCLPLACVQAVLCGALAAAGHTQSQYRDAPAAQPRCLTFLATPPGGAAVGGRGTRPAPVTYPASVVGDLGPVDINPPVSAAAATTSTPVRVLDIMATDPEIATMWADLVECWGALAATHGMPTAWNGWGTRQQPQCGWAQVVRGVDVSPAPEAVSALEAEVTREGQMAWKNQENADTVEVDSLSLGDPDIRGEKLCGFGKWKMIMSGSEN
ncbi:hypothetical protein PAPYR_5174 [Paratrimastix pyriformis]|uniref:Uncharacterized protein n=1 Tax=Paratrimastix pyriformis TaxID=342808 RepID=A0ABQ8UJB5_9EUKA|nr:hypothetical protein PAPYR_5174 [Paratrimastix pyriformis]